ncbi:2-oxo-4-hydroxy-4-carboxy-5-ureidoimidazoline decarboxylase [Nocardia bovistercoris]|uniref:OHCU decarboxylase n=1 Tax=Nocardia bovistercoris TaxID=2785916 RepID=A0A931IGV5_9NOCA|nr:2-oxo-4-hydroxy-4-carboxy-5-ureidoimidazoline decarboxylase [Nocardia bovistercoris]MBH0781314.1 OHCU decarboxylase [Nocardia bovistercoris]
MLIHRGIGLDRFNTLPRARAVHALFACCGNVTWAVTLVDARPYADRDKLLAEADLELLALSQTDLDRALDAVPAEQLSGRTITELARVTRERIDRMLGPAEGYPEY